MAQAIPEIDYSQSLADIRQQFEDALADIQAALKSFLLTDAKRQDLIEAERIINDILSDLEKGIDKWADETGPSVVEESVLATLLLLGLVALAEDITLSAQQQALAEYTVEALKTDLKSVTANLQRQTRTVIRKTYTESIRRTRTQTRTEIRTAAKQMLDDADIAIIDKAGRRWRTSHYIDVVTNTHLMNAYREAAAIEGITNGNGHGYINYNKTTTDQCKDFHYKIVKLAPDIESSYPYFRDLPHLGHPNCRHFPIPIRNFDDVPAQVRQVNNL